MHDVVIVGGGTAGCVLASRLTEDPDVSVLLTTLLRRLRLARRVVAQEPLASFVDGEILPGADARTDDDLHAHVRALSQTLYHPAGTCRMGSDTASVVDPLLAFRGIDGLRIADASAIPTLPRGHTNWPTVMIAERASELVAAAL